MEAGGTGKGGGDDSVRMAALELALGSAIPGTVAALVRLGVFDALARAGPGAELTASEIAELAMPGKAISVAYLARLLRMVSGKGVLRELATATDGPDGRILVTERRYALEPIARYLVDDPERGSFRNLLLAFQMDGFLRTYERLHESVEDPSVFPFARANGGLSPWEYGKISPDLDTTFNKSMADHSTIYVSALLDAYQGFHDLKVLVDVAGGFGSSLRQITTRYPHIRGINFDQPHVIDASPEIPRVEHVSGDMFESVPSGGDAIFLKYILHDWNDERCLTLLRNCFEALPAGGKVIAVDNLLPEVIDAGAGVARASQSLALQSDIWMLAFNESGARERTEREYRELALQAGFRDVQVMCTVDLISLAEFRK